MKLAPGQPIGNWTLLQPDPDRKYHWLVECSCPSRTLKSVMASSLKSGKSQSCGCLRSQALSNRKSHGMTGTPIHNSWLNMRKRVKTANYRKRGISIHPRWDRFENFYADVGDKPEGHRISLERPDNHADYGPDNWEWATPTIQNRNKGNNVQITSSQFGTRPLAEWAAIMVEKTRDTTWTTRRLQSALAPDSMTIDRLFKGYDITDLRAECALPIAEDEFVAA